MFTVSLPRLLKDRRFSRWLPYLDDYAAEIFRLEGRGDVVGFLCGRCWMVLSRLSNEFSFRCIFVLFLSLSVLLPGIFWILPFRSLKSGFDAKQAIKLNAPVHAYFKLQKPISELVQHIEKLEYDIYEEIGVPNTKVAILSMHQSGASNSTDVMLGVLSDPINSCI